MNKHGGKGKAVGGTSRGGKNRVTQSTGRNTQPLGSKPDILDDDEETEDDKMEKVEEEEKNDKGRKQTARRGKPFSTGLGAGQIHKMMPKLKECEILLSKQDTVLLNESSEKPKRKSVKKKKEEKGIEVDENKKDENSDKTKQMENIQEDGNGKKEVEHGKSAVENIHPQEKEKGKTEEGEGLKSELDGKEHDNNLEDKNSGCHIENMIRYINNEETFGCDKNESMVEMVRGNVEGLNTNDDVTVADMLFQGETEQEKEERMQVIGTSLKISQLEDDLDNILRQKLRVSDTEERIDRLKNVIILLQGFTYSGKEKEDKDSLKKGENDGNKKESEEQHTEKDKSDECQKGIKEHDSVNNRSKEDDKNEGKK